jgi:hypothetical protein
MYFHQSSEIEDADYSSIQSWQNAHKRCYWSDKRLVLGHQLVAFADCDAKTGGPSWPSLLPAAVYRWRSGGRGRGRGRTEAEETAEVRQAREQLQQAVRALLMALICHQVGQPEVPVARAELLRHAEPAGPLAGRAAAAAEEA